MEQLTREQALAIFNSDIWKSWTDDQIVRFQLYQDRLCLPFGRFRKAMEHIFDRPMWTHEFANQQGLIAEYEGKQRAPTIQEIIEMIRAEKRIIHAL